MTPTAATIATLPTKPRRPAPGGTRAPADSPRPRAKPRRWSSMRLDRSAMNTSLSRPRTTFMATKVASAAHALGSAASRMKMSMRRSVHPPTSPPDGWRRANQWRQSRRFQARKIPLRTRQRQESPERCSKRNRRASLPADCNRSDWRDRRRRSTLSHCSLLFECSAMAVQVQRARRRRDEPPGRAL